LELPFANLKDAANERTKLSGNAKGKKRFSEPGHTFSWKYHKSGLYIAIPVAFMAKSEIPN
jgi:hypothetical protein